MPHERAEVVHGKDSGGVRVMVSVMRALTVTALSLYAIGAFAFTHGINTTFDPNSFGGNWTCFRSLASGTCGGATTHYFNAACDGVTDDSPALNAFTAYGQALNPALVNIYWPPGSKCTFLGNNTITWDQVSGNGINNVNIWAYGATANIIDVGGSAFYQDTVHRAFIATVSSGASSISVTDGNIARFSIGDNIRITGDCLDNSGGNPPSFQFFESNTIANISGNTITLGVPTSNAYKSTWPVCSGFMGNAGAATIFKIPPSWNTALHLWGITVTNAAAAQINVILKSAVFNGVVVQKGTIAPSGVDSFTSNNSLYVDGAEIDKVSKTMSFNYDTIGQIVVQTSSPVTLALNNVTETCSINGTAYNTSILNTKVASGGCDGRIAVGPTGAGHGNSVVVNNSTFPVAAMSEEETLVSNYTYSTGTFTLAKSAGSSTVNEFFFLLVPGFEYKLAYHNAFQNSCTPLTTFFVTDLREDASNYYADTGTWVQSGSPVATPAVLPALTCSTAEMIVAYPAQTITQTNTGASPSLTQFAPSQ